MPISKRQTVRFKHHLHLSVSTRGNINDTGCSFRQNRPRSDADSAATGGDLRHFPGFTDYDGLAPKTLVFETRMNITSAGMIPTTEADGLNPNPARPAQVYSYPIVLEIR